MTPAPRKLTPIVFNIRSAWVGDAEVTITRRLDRVGYYAFVDVNDEVHAIPVPDCSDASLVWAAECAR